MRGKEGGGEHENGKQTTRAQGVEGEEQGNWSTGTAGKGHVPGAINPGGVRGCATRTFPPPGLDGPPARWCMEGVCVHGLHGERRRRRRRSEWGARIAWGEKEEEK